MRVREGTLDGCLPYLAVGSGLPLVYLGGGSPNHRNPKPGLERQLTVRTLVPFARAGREVVYVSRWPGMAVDITWREVAARHAQALAASFEGPVDVFGHSTGGSIVLQLIVDHPEVVRRAVVASAAYALGPVARHAQHQVLQVLQTSGRYAAEELLDGLIKTRWVRRLLRPAMRLASRAITVDNVTDAVAMIKAEDGFDVHQQLAAADVATLVACGGKDRFYSQEMFTETAHRLPNGCLAVYPHLGHNLVSSTAFVADVVRFLDRTGGVDR